jgi:hypothetical protein
MNHDTMEETDMQHRRTQRNGIEKRRVSRGMLAAASVALAVVFGGAWNATLAHGEHQDGRRSVSLPLGAVGLVAGDGIRTTLINRGPRQIIAAAIVLDADGQIVKQETVVIPPGVSQSVAMGRSEVARSEQSVMVRTEIGVRASDAAHLVMITEVIDWATGATRLLAGTRGGCTGPTFMCGSNGNHNETLVNAITVDTRFVAGSRCPSWACGPGGNHNETLVRD